MLSFAQSDMTLMPNLSHKTFPKNVALIMDGNGRWAKERGLARTEGHREGIKSVDEIVTTAAELNLQSLVLYAFSSENWNRPKTEITILMTYLSHYLDEKLEKMKRENIRFQVIGRIQDLSQGIIAKIERNILETRNNTGLRLVLALSYGGRNEILDTTRKIAEKVARHELKPEDISEEMFQENLYLPDLPDPDLLIRTSGEMRISNFLLWQVSYAELVVTKTLWPDFRKEQFLEAMEEYSRRFRRFGKSD